MSKTNWVHNALLYLYFGVLRNHASCFGLGWILAHLICSSEVPPALFVFLFVCSSGGSSSPSNGLSSSSYTGLHLQFSGEQLQPKREWILLQPFSLCSLTNYTFFLPGFLNLHISCGMFYQSCRLNLNHESCAVWTLTMVFALLS